MMKLYLLDHRSEIFQTFSDISQLFSFLNRQTRNQKGKTLIAVNDTKAVANILNNESPLEINNLALKMLNQINKS